MERSEVKNPCDALVVVCVAAFGVLPLERDLYLWLKAAKGLRYRSTVWILHAGCALRMTALNFMGVLIE
jgi:hypothetical protein